MTTRRHEPEHAEPPLPRARLAAPRRRGMSRDRLNRMLAGVWDAGFGLVVGPAGSGKTTFLGQFAEAAGVPVAWYRADAADNTAPAFLAGLERSASEAFNLRQGGWISAERAAAALESWPGERGLLVVDDLHVLYGSEAEAAFGRLIDFLPPAVSAVAGSRRSPAFDISRGRVSGGLVEIGADDLRFRSWEVETLFREFYGEPLPPGGHGRTRPPDGRLAGRPHPLPSRHPGEAGAGTPPPGGDAGRQLPAGA